MDVYSAWLIFAGGLILSSTLIFGLRSACLASLGQMTDELSSKAATSLQPVELAYLLRPGDAGHCLVVVAVDLIQKGLKSPTAVEKEVKLLPYEREIWVAVQKYLKDWGQRKAEELVPDLKRGASPVRLAWGLWKMRKMIFDGLKGVLSEVVKDPRNLKRYFSAAGLLRFLVDVWSTSIKENLSTGIRTGLLEKNLLATTQDRDRCASQLLLLAILHLGILGALFAFFSGLQLQQAAFLIFAAAFNALIIGGLLGLRSFLPFYEEVSLVLSAIKRGGWRVILLRFVLRVLHVVSGGALFLIATILLIVQTVVAHGALTIHPWGDAWALTLVTMLLLSLSCWLVLNLCLSWWNVKNTDQLTGRAQALTHEYRRSLSHESPIAALSAALSDPQYDDKLSLIVALYGIETVWLLA